MRSPTPPPWEDVLAVFGQVVDAEPAERSDLLNRLCAHDKGLLEAAQQLLSADSSSPDLFLEDTELLSYFEASRPREEVGLRAGGRFARFEIVRLLAEGGMGSVYLARQERPGREVALKVLRAGLASEDLVRRFEREVAVLGRLQHPNIAAIYEAGVHQGVPYFAMEYIRGVPITEHATRLDSEGCVALMLAVCHAVSHAHEQGVVHRDLKPDNILVDGSGEPKVLDFGVARLTDVEGHLATLATNPGQILGTLAYMSPEQAAGGAFEVDGRADVYALGVILFELLAGRRPLEVERRPIPEALRILSDVDPVLLGDLDPSLRGDLEIIVAKALEKDPARRYDSVIALADDLERARSNRPITARPPSTLYQMRKFAHRHRTLVGGVVATIATLVLGVAVSLSYAIDARKQRDVAERANGEARLSLYRTSLLAARDALDSGDAASARALLAAAPEERRGFEHRHIAAQLDKSFAGLMGDWIPLAWFPDGERVLLSGGAGIAIWRVGAGDAAADVSTHGASHAAIDGAGLAPPSTSKPATPLQLTWPLDERADHVAMADGGRLVAATTASTLLVWDVATRASLAKVDLGASPAALAVRPGTAELALALGATVHRIDGTSGRTIGTWSEHFGDVRQLSYTADGDRLVATTSWDVSSVDLETGVAGPSWPLVDHDPGQREPLPFIVHPEGPRITVSVGRNSDLLSLDVITGERTWMASVKYDPPSFWAVDPLSGRHLVTGKANGSVRLIESASGAPVGKVLRGADPPKSFAFHVETGRIALGTVKGLRVYDGRTQGELALTGHRAAVTSLEFSADGSRLVSASADESSVRVWDLSGSQQPGGCVLRGHTNWLLGLAFSPDGEWLATSGWDFTVRLWEVATGNCFAVLPIQSTKINGAAFSADSERLLVNGHGVEDFLVDLATGEVSPVTRDLRLDHQLNDAGQYSPGTLFTALDRDGPVQLGVFRAMSPDASVSATEQGTAPVVMTLGAEPNALKEGVHEVVQQFGRIGAVALSPDGEAYSVAYRDGNVRLYETSTQRPIAVLRGHSGWVYGMAFNPAGTRLAAGARDGTIRLWDLADHEPLAVLRGHESYVHAVAFSPDGETLASVSGDFTARLWDTHSARERAEIAATAWTRREAIRPRVLALFDRLLNGGAVRQVLDEDPSLTPAMHVAGRIEVLVEALKREP